VTLWQQILFVLGLFPKRPQARLLVVGNSPDVGPYRTMTLRGEEGPVNTAPLFTAEEARRLSTTVVECPDEEFGTVLADIRASAMRGEQRRVVLCSAPAYRDDVLKRLRSLKFDVYLGNTNRALIVSWEKR
jgi:hypothetical protein